MKRGKKPMNDERYIEHCMSRIADIKVELAGKTINARTRYRLLNQKVAQEVRMNARLEVVQRRRKVDAVSRAL